MGLPNYPLHANAGPERWSREEIRRYQERRQHIESWARDIATRAYEHLERLDSEFRLRLSEDLPPPASSDQDATPGVQGVQAETKADQCHLPLLGQLSKDTQAQIEICRDALKRLERREGRLARLNSLLPVEKEIAELRKELGL